MNKIILIFTVLVTILSTNSCSLDDGPNFNFIPLSIKEVSLPETFSLNQIYEISVTYDKPNSCSSFRGFDVSKKALTDRNVVVIGIERIDQNNCSEAIVEETATFDFKVVHNQTYLFRFWKGEHTDGTQEYIEIEVPVE